MTQPNLHRRCCCCADPNHGLTLLADSATRREIHQRRRSFNLPSLPMLPQKGKIKPRNQPIEATEISDNCLQTHRMSNLRHDGNKGFSKTHPKIPRKTQANPTLSNNIHCDIERRLWRGGIICGDLVSGKVSGGKFVNLLPKRRQLLIKPDWILWIPSALEIILTESCLSCSN